MRELIISDKYDEEDDDEEKVKTIREYYEGEDLKSCPCCGGKAIAYSDYYDPPAAHYSFCPAGSYVECTNCNVNTCDGNIESAIKQWNRRTY